MRRSLGVISVVLAVGLLSALGATAQGGDPLERVAEADRLFDRWSKPFDFAAYEESLRGAIDLWESALVNLPEDNVQSRAHTLDRLAQAYFELAEGYLTDGGKKEAAYEAGKDAALASLRLNPTFDATEAKSGFRAALLSATDVEAIFWYGNALGQWLNYHVITAITGGVRDVAASFERSLELDETYDGAGPHRAMGSLIAQAYYVIGRSRDDAAVHFERCIELAPNHLEARVSYAEQYARPTGDTDLFKTLLDEVLALAEDPSVMAAYPFYNELSVRRARALGDGG
jgi:tetratricopeptide (TPR) repeat protein